MTLKESEVVNRLRDAVIALKDVRYQRDALLREKSEPIAIVGTACRFPGEANTPEAYFDLLLNGFDAVTAVPAERWPIDPAIDADAKLQGARWGAFVKNVDLFEPEFFGISPREAVRMDPQQRMLLEATWEAFESGGIVPASLAGTKTGVFVGLMNTDYYLMNLTLPHERQDAYSATGNGHCFVAGRLSYTFGFYGPAITVDTACSSSLVATHLACQSLRTADSDVAIVCGVSLMLDPLVSELTAKTGALAPDGRCKSFDARANGYVRGEGCGVIILKRLSDAQRDGNSIVAVIRGSAVNQDGRSTGLTTPNVLSQQAMLEQALANAQLSAEDISYIEAHGTGTPLGDPIEMDALRTVFGKPRADGGRCLVGTVKTNIGHLEAAAGVAGILKIALALRHEKIPQNLHMRTLNPRITLTGTPLAIATETVPWPRSDKPRRAGVSSFGMSGTNAHVVLEEAPRTESEAPKRVHATHLLPLSAKTPDALLASARAYAHWFLVHSNVPLEDVVHTASIGRTHHENRLAVVAREHEEFSRLLSSYAAGEGLSSVVQGRTRVHDPPKVVFVFPGQGSQWIGMGRELLSEEPAFRKAIEACDRAIQTEAGFSIIEQINADETQSRIGEIDVLQPLLFAIEVSLAALWQSWGIIPDCVVGHSMGEVAAAYVAGMLMLDDAAKIICRRSRIMRRIRGQGGMGLVELSMDEVEAAIAAFEGQLSVAVSNGPRSTVLSGDAAALEIVLAGLERRGVFCRRIKVDVASHSPQVDVLHDELLDVLCDVKSTRGSLRMISTVTGKEVQHVDLSAQYWWNNLRQPVRFAQVTRDLSREERTVFIELSPHPILLGAMEETLNDSSNDGAAIESMLRNAPQRSVMLKALGMLWVRGYRIDWTKTHSSGRVVPLPTYPWQRERYWIERTTSAGVSGWYAKGKHPLLGASFTTSLRESPNTWIWQSVWSLEELPFLADHRIGGRVLVPGAAYVEAAFAAARELLDTNHLVIEDMYFVTPLVLERATPLSVEVSLVSEPHNSVSFRFSSCKLETKATSNFPTWTLHARARILRGSEDPPASVHLANAQRDCRSAVALDTIKKAEESFGMNIGPLFQGLQEMWREGSRLLGRIALPDLPNTSGGDYFVHPIILDSAIRVIVSAIPPSDDGSIHALVGIRRLKFWNGGGSAVWTVGDIPNATDLAAASMTLFDNQGMALLSIEGFESGRLAHVAHPKDTLGRIFFRQEWMPLDIHLEKSARGFSGRWLILCDDDGFGESVGRILSERGADVVYIWSGAGPNLANSSRLEVNLEAPEAVVAMFRDVMRNGAQLRGIINSWGLWPKSETLVTRNVLHDAQVFGCGGTLHLVQALSRLGLSEMPQLWLVVRGTQAIHHEAQDVCIAQAPLWGLGRTIANEFPEMRCVRVDLAPTAGPREAGEFCALLDMNEFEEELALRNGRAYAGALVVSELPPAMTAAATIRRGASYLITGGLGGLGLLAARWLAKSGAQHIALLSRSGLTTANQAKAVEELTALGAQTMVLKADVEDSAQLGEAFAEINAKWPPLKGILHTAGVLEDGILDKQTLANFRKVLGPKMIGTWNLHEQTIHLNLDFFILYSSMAALLGSPGLACYVAANSFMDSFAHYRRWRGLAATSINWGLFVESGMGQKAQSIGQLFERGVGSFDASDGEMLLSRIIHDGWTQMGLISIDTRAFAESNPQLVLSPRFSKVFAKSSHRPSDADAIRQMALRGSDGKPIADDRAGNPLIKLLAGFREKLQLAPQCDRLGLLEDHVCQHLAQVLRMKSSKIDRKQHFQVYGVDSLMAVELRNRLQSSLDVRLSLADIWSQGSVAAISNLLLDRIGFTPESACAVEQLPTEQRAPTATGIISSEGWIVTHQPRAAARMRLICFPYAGGGAPVYATWSESLPEEIEVCAVQLPGRYERIAEPPLQSVAEIADAVVQALLPLLNLPFAMFGHCLGSVIMLEVARRFAQNHGFCPVHLFASGAPPPQLYLVPNVLTRPDDEFIAILRAIGFANENLLLDQDVVHSLLPIVRADFGVAARYKYSPAPRINAPITAFVADADTFAPAHIVGGWQAETSCELSTHTYSGGHYFLVPQREAMCRIIAADLDHHLSSIEQEVLDESARVRWINRVEARTNPQLRIFCCPGLGGDASSFEHLAALMPPDVELCVVELPGHGTRASERPLGRVEDLISHLTTALEGWLDRPFALLGHDLGALALYEVMRRIRRRGGPSPRIFFVLAAMAPHVHYFAPLQHLPTKAFIEFLRMVGLRCSDDQAVQRALRADCAMLTSYQFRDDIFVTVPIVVFVAEQDALIPPMSVPQWQQHTMGSFELHRIACDHAQLVSDPAALGAIYLQIANVKR